MNTKVEKLYYINFVVQKIPSKSCNNILKINGDEQHTLFSNFFNSQCKLKLRSLYRLSIALMIVYILITLIVAMYLKDSNFNRITIKMYLKLDY